MMLGENSGMQLGGCFVLLTVMIGAFVGAVALRRGDRRAVGRPRPNTWSGLMIAGTAPGVLLRVALPWVRGAAL